MTMVPWLDTVVTRELVVNAFVKPDKAENADVTAAKHDSCSRNTI